MMYTQFSSKLSLIMPRICLSAAKTSCTILQCSLLELANHTNPNGGGAYATQQVRFRSNRSRRGLYDGKDIRTGNNVSFSMRHTKRKFRPNVFIKRVYSEILDSMIPFHLTTSALRSIDKAGGLDTYLLNNDDITEGEGLKIKKCILKRLKNQEYFAHKIPGNAIGSDLISEDDNVNETKGVEKIEVMA